MKKIYNLLLMMLVGTLAMAQPANDECVNAIAVAIAADEASCTATTATTVGGTGSAAPDFVCSGSWFGDDIWFSFTTGATVPANGVIVKTYFGNVGQVPAVGMAVYPDCGTAALPFACFSSSNPADDEIIIYPASLATNATYYVRVWSGVSPTANSGTVDICVFEADLLVEDDIIVWGNTPGEGDFDGGLNGWTTVGLLDPTTVWEWTPTASAFGYWTSVVLNSVTAGNGAMVFNSDAYNSVGGTVEPVGPPYQKNSAELVSPIIDLSGVTSEVQVRFTQSFRGLNGDDAGLTDVGALFSFSTDGGTTWSDNTPVNDDLGANNGSPNPDVRRMDMPGASGSSNVQVRFTFDGDFYYWILDDVKIVERPANSTGIPPRGQAIAENYATPQSQIAPIYLGSYASNLGSAAQTNVTVAVETDYYDNAGTLVTDNTFTGSTQINILDIDTDSLIMLPETQTFTPSDGQGFYVSEYTLSQDEVDVDPANNTATSEFRITSQTYSKAPLDANGKPIDTNSFSPAGGGAFEYGIHLFVPNGMGQKADSITFGYSGGADGLSGQSVTVYLKRWNDLSDDGLIDDTELEVIAYNFYTYTTEENNQQITLPLIDFSTNTNGVPLEDNTHYLLTAEYVGLDQMFLNFYEDIDYDPMIDASIDRANAANDVTLVRYGDVLRTSAWFTRGFTTPGVPAIATYISSLTIANEETERLEAQVDVYPNPVNEELTITLETVETGDWNVRITDVTGRTVMPRMEQATFPLQLNVKTLASGTYMLTLEHEGQVITKRFVKK